jgi:hypothetical protein
MAPSDFPAGLLSEPLSPIAHELLVDLMALSAARAAGLSVVLLVDEDVALRRFLAAIFRSRGAVVVEADGASFERAAALVRALGIEPTLVAATSVAIDALSGPGKAPQVGPNALEEARVDPPIAE